MKILVIGETNVAPYTKRHFEEIQKAYNSTPHPHPLPQGEREKDTQRKSDDSLIIIPTEDTKKITSDLGSADIIITSPFHQHLIDLKLAKNLKWVHLSSAGVTDMAKFLAPTKIMLTNSSGVHPIPISETVLGYMLMFGRRLNVAYRNQIINKKWSRDLSQNKGFELKGKTVGIVGLGRIGKEIEKVSKGIGMNVISVSHSDKKTQLVNLLKSSDFVVDCLPLTDETLGFFSLNKFKHMRKDSYFINIGRGKTVIEKDLILALKDGIIAGAGLDVFEVEPLPDSSPLWKLENVILTPHVSGWTPYYTDRVIDIFCENLKGYLKGKSMPTLVDKKRRY